MQKINSIQKLTSFDTKIDGMIHDSQYDYYGKRLATSSSDGVINIFDVSQTDKPVHMKQIKAHTGPVWQLAWAHPRFGNVIASCSFDKKIIVWKEFKTNEWIQIVQFSNHKSSVNSVKWCPFEYGLKLAACSTDGHISVYTRKSDDKWETTTSFMAHQMGVNAISWEPTCLNVDFKSESLREKDYPMIVSGSCDKSLKVWKWDESSSEFKSVLEFKGNEDNGHSDWVRDVAWCPAIGNTYDMIASCSEDQTVRIWKFEQINENEYEQIGKPDLVFHSDESPVWRVNWNTTGSLLAVASANKNYENCVYIFQENDQGIWEKVANIDDDKKE